jgi:hypothetical protein
MSSIPRQVDFQSKIPRLNSSNQKERISEASCSKFKLDLYKNNTNEAAKQYYQVSERSAR